MKPFSKYDRFETYESEYLYPGTEVLINLMNIRDQNKLDRYEEEVTRIRTLMIELENAVTGRFSFTHFCKLHKFVFQDVYPFAGKLRFEDISKGTTEFCKVPYIEAQLKKQLEELKSENFLKGLPFESFSDRLAHYMAELNIIHPFREGNGRILRIFIRQLSLHCGYDIDWTMIERDEYMNAIIHTVYADNNLLVECLRKALSAIY